MKEIGKAVRVRRKELRMTQEDLAVLSGCSELFVGNVEMGKPTVQMNKLLDLLNTLGLQIVITDRND